MIKLLASLLLVCACANSRVGGVALTFDDGPMVSWCKFQKEFGFPDKVTFFVSRPQTRSKKDFECAEQLESQGFEIGNHTISHINAVDFLKTHTLNEYIETEVRPLEFRGAFAFPFSADNKTLIDGLMTTGMFKVLRGGYRGKYSNVQDFGKVFYSSMPIDLKAKYSDNEILAALVRAKQRGQIAVFHGHSIDAESSDSRSTRILLIIKQAKRLGLKFYNLSELN